MRSESVFSHGRLLQRFFCLADHPPTISPAGKTSPISPVVWPVKGTISWGERRADDRHDLGAKLLGLRACFFRLFPASARRMACEARGARRRRPASRAGGKNSLQVSKRTASSDSAAMICSLQAGRSKPPRRREIGCPRWRPGPLGPKRRRARGPRRLPRRPRRDRIYCVHDLGDERHCSDAGRHALTAGLASLGDDDVYATLRRLARLAHRVHLMDHLGADVVRAFDQACRIAQGERNRRGLRVEGCLECVLVELRYDVIDDERRSVSFLTASISAAIPSAEPKTAPRLPIAPASATAAMSSWGSRRPNRCLDDRGLDIEQVAQRGIDHRAS